MISQGAQNTELRPNSYTEIWPKFDIFRVPNDQILCWGESLLIDKGAHFTTLTALFVTLFRNKSVTKSAVREAKCAPLAVDVDGFYSMGSVKHSDAVPKKNHMQ